MDLKYLKRLMDIFDASTATKLDIEEEGIKLKISKVEKEGKSNLAMYPVQHAAPAVQQQPAPAPELPAAATMEEIKKPIEEVAHKYHEIKSPIVGTFYRAPSPESESYIEVGSKITKGTVLCIIEAMKLMNEIESDVTGTVEKILVENSSPVEFNQVMFLIKPE